MDAGQGSRYRIGDRRTLWGIGMWLCKCVAVLVWRRV